MGYRRGTHNEPTLMIGDLSPDIDCDLIDRIVFNFHPAPIKSRRSTTRVTPKQNVFYQYADFDTARHVWRALNGLKVDGRCGLPDGFQLDITFAAQRDEVHAFLRVDDVHLTRFEVYRILWRCTSVLGLSQHQFGQDERGRVRTACFVRFGDREDCIQAVTELNKMPVESGFISMSFSARHIDHLKGYVVQREASRLLAGSPFLHNFYEKRRLTLDELNIITLSSSGEVFDDLEGSRWSSVVMRPNIDSLDYMRQMTLSFYEDF